MTYHAVCTQDRSTKDFMAGKIRLNIQTGLESLKYSAQKLTSKQKWANGPFRVSFVKLIIINFFLIFLNYRIYSNTRRDLQRSKTFFAATLTRGRPLYGVD